MGMDRLDILLFPHVLQALLLKNHPCWFRLLWQPVLFQLSVPLLHVKVEQKVEREQVAKVTGTNKDDSLAKAPVKRAETKVYPNDPCPCGSGKKYKQCCGRK